jgi:hypothetical protein
MLETAHWITIVLSLVSVLLGAGQMVFWYEIRQVNGRCDRTDGKIDELWDALGKCRTTHDSNAATKQDVAEVKGAISSLHRRIDALYELMLGRKEVKQ